MNNLKTDKRPTKSSRSGRDIIRPQKIITTSDDEPPHKKSKGTASTKERLQFLRNKWKEIESKRLEKSDKTLSTQSTLMKPTTQETKSDNSASLVTITNPQSTKPRTSKSSKSNNTTIALNLPKPGISKSSGGDVTTPDSNLAKPGTSKSSGGDVTITDSNLAKSGTSNSSGGNVTTTVSNLTKLETSKSSGGTVDSSKKKTVTIAASNVTKLEAGQLDNTVDLETVESDISESFENLLDNWEQREVPVFHKNDPHAPLGGEIIFGNQAADSDVIYKERVLTSLKIIQEQNKVLINQNEKISKQQQDILLALSKQKDSEEKELSFKLLRHADGFPLKSAEDFVKFESGEKEFRTNLFKHLLSLGGITIRHFLATSLRQAMTDELVCEFTWNGGENSTEFGNTKLANVLYMAAKRSPNFDGPKDKNIFKSHMLEVLRHTKQRYRNSLKKTVMDEESLRREIDELEAIERANEQTRNSENDSYENYDSEEEEADDES